MIDRAPEASFSPRPRVQPSQICIKKQQSPHISTKASLYQTLRLTLAPQVGLEPTTLRLTAECSAIELLRNEEGRKKVTGR